MPKFNKFNIGTSLAVFAMLSAPVAVYARDGVSGSGTSGSGSSTSTSGSTTTATSSTPETEHTVALETRTTADSAELQHSGSDMVTELQKKKSDNKKPEHSQKERKKICESHKDGLTNKFNHIASNSARIQTRIDDVFTKALAFQLSSNTQVTDFDTLVLAAKKAQTNSADSVAALKTVTPSIDCNSTSVASDVATFKTAAQQTRDNLKAYKTSVRAILHTLETAKDSTTEGSTHQ